MTSAEKFDILLDLEASDTKAKITTVRGDVYRCKVDSPAEDEDDWAYHFITPDYPTKYFILECDFIARIEKITETEWQRACANPIWNDEAAMSKWREEQKVAKAQWNAAIKEEL